MINLQLFDSIAPSPPRSECTVADFVPKLLPQFFLTQPISSYLSVLKICKTTSPPAAFLPVGNDISRSKCAAIVVCFELTNKHFMIRINCICFLFQFLPIILNGQIDRVFHESADCIFSFKDTMSGSIVSIEYGETSDGYAIFKTINDTLDGDYFRFYKSGSIKCWYTYKMGRLWTTHIYMTSQGEEMNCGNVENGNGLIIVYEDVLYHNGGIVVPNPQLICDSSCVNKYRYTIYQIKNGLANGWAAYYSCNNDLIKDYSIRSNPDDFYVVDTCVILTFQEDLSIDTVVYIESYQKYIKEDTIRYFCRYNIVTAISIRDSCAKNNSGNSTNNQIILSPSDYYVPQEYRSKQNINMLRRLEKAVKKYNKNNKMDSFSLPLEYHFPSCPTCP